MMALHRLTVGDGYSYLTNSVARGDGDGADHSPLVDYYAASGYPAGRWLGSGLDGLNAGDGMEAGTVVTEEHMQRVFRDALDPVTGQSLGRPFTRTAPLSERIEARLAALPGDLDDATRAREETAIRRQETAKTRDAVAGFDLVFTLPKDVSALWAIADQPTQTAIYRAHQAAVQDTLERIEREAAFTRTGHRGVAQTDVHGVVAAAFDHWDSRAGDPHLHTHLVIANRVQGGDGKWRTLDSKALYGSTVALSEFHQNALADRLAADLGLAFDVDDKHTLTVADAETSKTRAVTVRGVPDALVEEFSARTEQVDANLADLVAQYEADYGTTPPPRTLYALKQRAWRMERPRKDSVNVRSLADSSTAWRARGAAVLGRDPGSVVDAAVGAYKGQIITADDVTSERVDAFAVLTLRQLETSQSTWTRANVWAEAERQTRALRFTDPDQRRQAVDRIVDVVTGGSVDLSPPELFETPDVLKRRDGTSIYTPTGSVRYSSRAVLGAERTLLDAMERTDAVSVDAQTAGVVLAGSSLSEEQRRVVVDLAASQRQVDVLVGPAGAGKTTTLRGLLEVWEHEHGKGSVVGLASSAKAAKVLGSELGISTENTDKWLWESVGAGRATRDEWLGKWRRVQQLAKPGSEAAKAAAQGIQDAQAEAARWTFRPGQLVIVDEASMAGTLNMAALATCAQQQGARIVFVGDPAQLGAVNAGGAFRMLVNERGQAPTLTEVHRFHAAWEKDASVALRDGLPAAADAYFEHGRVIGGNEDSMLEAVYAGWAADMSEGKSSVMVATDTETVRELNLRARAARVARGDVSLHGVTLNDDTVAGDGDVIVSRKNERRITDRRGDHVLNSDMWRITRTHRDGSLTVCHLDDPSRTVVMPETYVRSHVALGYAATIHRVQGMTTDTSHSLVSERMQLSHLYVAMTRGRESNRAYVVTQDAETEQHQAVQSDAYSVFTDVMNNRAAELSATETTQEAFATADSLPRLADIRDDLELHAAHTTWTTGLRDAGFDDTTIAAIHDSPRWPALVGALRAADDGGVNAHDALRAAAALPISDQKDPAAVLRSRVLAYATPLSRPLDPWRGRVLRCDDTAVVECHSQVTALIRSQVEEATQRVLANPPDWLTRLPARPGDAAGQYRWDGTVRRIVEYRERFEVRDDERPLGGITQPHTTEWREQTRAQAFIDELSATRGTAPEAAFSRAGALDEQQRLDRAYRQEGLDRD